MRESDRYLKIVEWSESDGYYVGTCPGVMHREVHGQEEARVYKELCRAVDAWVASSKRDKSQLPEATAGRPYSGKFVVRVDPGLHKALAIRARQHGESLNAFCRRVLQQAIERPSA